MREKLIQYIDLLFAGIADTDDIKQEILQNTLDRYDDLISQGKSPESAYSLAISGIGDIQEILGSGKATDPEARPIKRKTPSKGNHAILLAIAVALLILCPIPVILIGNVVGICVMFLMIASGVALLIIHSSMKSRNDPQEKTKISPLQRVLLGIAIGSGVTFYLLISLVTKAWLLTWMMLPIILCTCGVINACFDLNKHFISALVRIVIFVFLIGLLHVCMFGGYLAYSTFNRVDESTTNTTTTTTSEESAGSVSAQTVKDIEIQWVGGSITIQPSDVQDIQFYEDSGISQEDKMVWKQQGDRLTIQYCTGKVSLFGGTNVNVPAKNLVITVPRDWGCDELEIDSVSAEISMGGISAREASIVNVSGFCRVSGCSFTELELNTVSGNVFFDGTTNSLEMTSVSAKCTAKLVSSPREIELETVSGDLTLILQEDCGFTLSLDSVSGSLISDFPTTTQNHRYTYGNGNCRISADTVSGDIMIKNPN